METCPKFNVYNYPLKCFGASVEWCAKGTLLLSLKGCLGYGFSEYFFPSNVWFIFNNSYIYIILIMYAYESLYLEEKSLFYFFLL